MNNFLITSIVLSLSVFRYCFVGNFAVLLKSQMLTHKYPRKPPKSANLPFYSYVATIDFQQTDVRLVTSFIMSSKSIAFVTGLAFIDFLFHRQCVDNMFQPKYFYDFHHILNTPIWLSFLFTFPLPTCRRVLLSTVWFYWHAWLCVIINFILVIQLPHSHSLIYVCPVL